MTDPNNTEQADTDAGDTDDQTDADPGDDQAPNREAAAYRRRLRDTETERDALAGRVEALQRREAERIAGEHLADPTDLWLLDDDLGALLTDGDVDLTKVVAAVRDGATGQAEQRPAPASPARATVVCRTTEWARRCVNSPGPGQHLHGGGDSDRSYGRSRVLLRPDPVPV